MQTTFLSHKLIFAWKNKCQAPSLTNIPASRLPQSFCEFFTGKIKRIRQTLNNTPFSHVPTVLSDITTPLVQFAPVSEEEQLHSILKKTSQKTSELDPLPTSLHYEHIELLLHTLTSIIKRSLLSGEFPSEFTTASGCQTSSQLKKPILIPTK